MNHHHSQTTPLQAQEALTLALQARAAIDAWNRALAERGLTPQACLDAVRRTGGEVAVAHVHDEVARTLRALDEKVERESMHSSIPASAVARRVARRDIV